MKDDDLCQSDIKRKRGKIFNKKQNYWHILIKANFTTKIHPKMTSHHIF